MPILRIFSEAKAREFYVDFLDFTVEWEHRFEPGMPLYMQVRWDDVVLHLSEHHGDATPGSTVFVPVANVEALHRELVGKRYGDARPGLVDLLWGRQIEVADPFGNRLRLCEPTPQQV